MPWRTGSVHTLGPLALMDATDARATGWQGRTVRVIQPTGCPRNGTMGMIYVEDAESGEFIGLVCTSSLH